MQCNNWSSLYKKGDWIVEHRKSPQGKSYGLFLFHMVDNDKEEQIKLPDDFLSIVIHGRLKISDCVIENSQD